jgi:hypothetical protein
VSYDLFFLIKTDERFKTASKQKNELYFDVWFKLGRMEY